jgi:hypothetical protein
MANLCAHRVGARHYQITALTILLVYDLGWVDFGANTMKSALAIGVQARYCLPVLLLLLSLGVAVAAPEPITISVSPTADCVISGQQGGSFAPFQCEYLVTTNRAWANVKVSGIPPWLIPSTTFGRTPLTVTLALDHTYAAQQLDGNYSATISFSNITGSAGSTMHKALLTVTELQPPDATATSSVVIQSTSPPPPSGEYLLSDVGQVLTTGTGDRLLLK